MAELKIQAERGSCVHTTKERVLEAAKSCPQADAVLRKLFPETFTTPDNRVDTKTFTFRYNVDPQRPWSLMSGDRMVLEPRNPVHYKDSLKDSFYLCTSDFSFTIAQDDYDVTILKITKKF